LREAGLGNKGGSLEGLSFDLADLKAVASGASEFLKKETRLDILSEGLTFGYRTAR
jgi:hypothetical protein